jgi:hypothetical protein
MIFIAFLHDGRARRPMPSYFKPLATAQASL